MIPQFDVPGFFFPPELSLEKAIEYQDSIVAQEIARQRERDAFLEAAENAAETSADERKNELNPYILPDFDTLTPVSEWIERNCYNVKTVDPVKLDYWNGQLIRLEPHQRRILDHIFQQSKDKISPYTTIIWSEPKKCGKTMIAACIVAYFAHNIDPPNNVLVIANKRDQAKGRTYQSALPTLKALGADIQTARSSKTEVRLPNGTTVKALANNPESEAGDAYCLTAWSEIWAYKHDTDEKLFAELMPVETMRVSMQWIETYAGYWDESLTLKRLYLEAYTDETERVLKPGAHYVEELKDITTDGHPCCIAIPEKEMFVYWSHERRMPWQTEHKKRVEMSRLTKVEGIRLMENRWQDSSSTLLEEHWIARSSNAETEREVESFSDAKLVLAVDASQRHDNISLVGSFKRDGIYYTKLVDIFEPKGKDADLYELVELRVKQLYDNGALASYYDEDEERWITPVYFDPYQLHQIRLNCIEYGIDVIEFNQGTMRTESDTMLFEQYREGNVRNPNRDDFRSHLRAGKAKYLEGEKIRIVKGTTQDAKKIDALVAQSMSIYGAFLLDEKLLTQEDTSSVLSQGSASGWGWGD